jgi:AhpD family alkylhydroperoxidase
MKKRLDFYAAAPEGVKALLGLERYLHDSSIEKPLIELVKLRASQINGCAYCLDMHWKDARAAGETEQRLCGLNAWEEAPYYSERERAALLWTETLTLVHESHASDDAFARVRPHFSDRELTDLTLLIGTINTWNRLAIGFRSEAGSYQPAIRKN